MAAAATDLLQEVAIATATTLDSNYTIGDTSITVASTSGMPTATGITFAMDVVDGSGEQVAGSYNEYVGTVATASSITNVSHQNGTNRNYSAGATTRVYIPVSAERENRIVEWGLTEHNQNGTHKIAELLDTNGNELIKFTTTASAVNEVTLANAATGNAPTLSATGGDTNVDLRLVPKGTGNVKRGATGGAIDWWEEIGRTTLSVAGDTVSVTSIPARKYLKILIYVINTGGTVDPFLRFNNDSGNNYARRFSTNGAADTTAASGSTVVALGAAAYPVFLTVEVENFAAQEKMINYQTVAQNTAGAGNLPGRTLGVAKWANTSDQITRVDVTNNAGTGDFAIGSEVIVLGHD